MESQNSEFMRLILADEHSAVAQLLDEHRELHDCLNKGVFNWNMPPLAAAKSQEMVDVLLKYGARVETVAQWWAPGLGVDQVEPTIARYLKQRGAHLSIHAATGMGLTDVVRQMVNQTPELALAKGGDGCHPLHFCKEQGIAQILLEHGAEVDARDEDHDSTPAQWRIDDAPECVRFLLAKGATPDPFMAAGLGDLDLAKQCVTDDPSCTAHRIGNNKGPFPGIGFQNRGGSIYQWSLGFNLSPHEVALKRGHTSVYEYLIDNSSPETKFLVGCTSANRALAEAVTTDYPQIVGTLDGEDLALLAKFCWETNKSIEAVTLMLDLGFPIDVPESNHGYTALHNAAWCGDPDLVQLLIERGHPTDVRDPEHGSTPLGWAIHSCVEARRHPQGKFSEVVQLLLDSGTPFDEQHFPVGHEEIDKVLSRYLESQG